MNHESIGQRCGGTKHLVLLLPLLLLAGCATPPSGVPTRTIVWHQTCDVNNACIAAGGAKPLVGAYNACALYRRDPCEIFACVPKGADDRRALQALGHEVGHCFLGTERYN